MPGWNNNRDHLHSSWNNRISWLHSVHNRTCSIRKNDYEYAGRNWSWCVQSMEERRWKHNSTWRSNGCIHTVRRRNSDRLHCNAWRNSWWSSGSSWRIRRNSMDCKLCTPAEVPERNNDRNRLYSSWKNNISWLHSIYNRTCSIRWNDHKYAGRNWGWCVQRMEERRWKHNSTWRGNSCIHSVRRRNSNWLHSNAWWNSWWSSEDSRRTWRNSLDC